MTTLFGKKSGYIIKEHKFEHKIKKTFKELKKGDKIYCIIVNLINAEIYELEVIDNIYHFDSNECEIIYKYINKDDYSDHKIYLSANLDSQYDIYIDKENALINYELSIQKYIDEHLNYIKILQDKLYNII